MLRGFSKAANLGRVPKDNRRYSFCCYPNSTVGLDFDYVFAKDVSKWTYTVRPTHARDHQILVVRERV